MLTNGINDDIISSPNKGEVKMKYTKKLKMAMAALDITQEKLAQLTNQSKQNLWQKINAGNFRIKDYEDWLSAMGCKLEVHILLPDGERL